MKFKDLKVGQKFRFEGQKGEWVKEAEEWDESLYGPANCRDKKGNGACANGREKVEVVKS